jgi:hypothetical protein
MALLTTSGAMLAIITSVPGGVATYAVEAEVGDASRGALIAGLFLIVNTAVTWYLGSRRPKRLEQRMDVGAARMEAWEQERERMAEARMADAKLLHEREEALQRLNHRVEQLIKLAASYAGTEPMREGARELAEGDEPAG